MNGDQLKKFYEDLVNENEELRAQLDEAQEVLTAIRTGSIDALVVEGPTGEQVYTLQGADYIYRVFIEHMNEGAVTIDADGMIVYANRLFADLVGLPLEQTLGVELPRFVSSADRPQWDELLREANGEPSRRELTLLSGSGESIPVLFSTRHLPVEPGRFYCCIVSDLRQQRLHEQLRRSEQRLRMLAEAMPHFVWEADEQGKAEYENQRWYDYTGLTHETTAHGGWLTVQHPDDASRLAKAWKKAVETGGEYDAETRFRRSVDGAYRWFRVRGAPVRDAEGRIQSWVSTCTDIHDGKEAELALRESEQRFRMIADNMGQLAWTCDKLGEVTWYNQRWLAYTGLSFEEMKDWGWKKVHHPDHVDRVVAGVTRSRESGEIWEDVFPLRGKDGQYRWFLSRAYPIHDHQGGIVRWFGTNTDITEQRQAEEALKEAQLRVQRWNVELEQAVHVKTAELQQSHDRLRAMATELNLAEQRERKRIATELHDHLQQMLVLGKLTVGQGKRAAAGVPACEQLLKNVDDILSDALTYTRTLVSDLSPTVLRDHGLAAALQWLATYMRKHNQLVTVSVPPGDDLKLPEAQVILLFQSVRELLINSAKHAGTGEALVQMMRHEDHLRIDVRDKGTGFDFAAAAAAAAGTTSGGISSKYGLYSIQERMRALGGSLSITSVRGQGTRATLTLPLATVEDGVEWEGGERVKHGQEAARGPSKRSPPSPTRSSLIRVLLVDDHIMVRQGLRAVLNAYADVELVGEAGNGEEAVRLVDQLRPQVVVIDINMPKMDGIEATEHIKWRYPETIVIGLSVNASKENEEALKRAGAVRLMTKEAAVEQLYDAIQETVKQGERPTRSINDLNQKSRIMSEGENPSFDGSVEVMRRH